MKKTVFSAFVLLSLAVSAGAADKPKLVRVPLTAAFIPQGFDSNDKAQVVLEGYFPSACYRLGPIKTSVNESTGTVQVEQWAYFHNVMCAQMIVPYQQEVSVGILNQGNYKVQDIKSKAMLGTLPIHLAHEAEPDEFVYASVRDAYILKEGPGPRIARVEGFLSNTCTRIKELRVIEESSTVLTVLPITEKVPGVPCNRVLVPFKEDVALPHLMGGRHLLHVRSLNGQSVNKLFDVITTPRR